MYLTKEEEDILNGEYGFGKQKALEILVALGKIYDADTLIPIKSAQISGVSYYNIGEAGLSFLRDISGNTRVQIKTTLNPGGMDLARWEEMKVNASFAEKQMEIIDIFKKMGVEPTLTCTPYLVGNSPKKGDHVAWAESSAVMYINSYLGAYSNRESGISALAAAIIGKTPRYGMHIKEQRKPNVRVKIETKIENSKDFGVLGYILSKKIGGEIPYIQGIKDIGEEGIKLLSASLATYTGLPIFHMEKITAEWDEFDLPKEVVEIDDHDFKYANEYLSDSFKEVDLVWIGCPHTSLKELKEIAKLLKNKKVKTELWITTSRKIKEEAKKDGIIEIIEESGAKVLCDTCVAVSPLKNIFKTLVTTSAKACYYSRGINRFLVKVTSSEKCIETAIKGVWSD